MRFNTIILSMLFFSVTLCAADDYEVQIANKNRYYQSFKDKPCLDCNKSAAVFDTDTLNSRMQDVNATIDKYKVKVGELSDKAKAQAKVVDGNVKSATGEANVKQMKQKILKDANYSFKGQEQDPWKKSYDDTKVTSLDEVEKLYINPNKKKEQMLAPRERVFVVVSSSMPDRIVREYLRTIKEQIDGQATVIMQGFIGGMVKMRPTVDYVKRVSEDGRYTGIEVHPDIVKTYGVDKVPAVLYIKDYDPINDNGNGITAKSKEYEIVYGAISLEGAIKKIHEKYPTKGLSKMLSKLRGEGAGFYGNSK